MRFVRLRRSRSRVSVRLRLRLRLRLRVQLVTTVELVIAMVVRVLLQLLMKVPLLAPAHRRPRQLRKRTCLHIGTRHAAALDAAAGAAIPRFDLHPERPASPSPSPSGAGRHSARPHGILRLCQHPRGMARSRCSTSWCAEVPASCRSPSCQAQSMCSASKSTARWTRAGWE